MSNRLFQGIVHQMRDTIDRVIGVVDDTATIISCSELSKIGETNEYLMLDLGENSDMFIRDGYTYKPFAGKDVYKRQRSDGWTVTNWILLPRPHHRPTSPSRPRPHRFRRNIHPDGAQLSRCSHAVSYTHLDVYKRQHHPRRRLYH